MVFTFPAGCPEVLNNTRGNHLSTTSTAAAVRAKQDKERLRAYFAALPPAVRRDLKKVRGAIKAAAPGAVDCISYGIPAMTLNGRIVLWYAGWTNHLSVYPLTAGARSALGDAIKGYKTSKGTIQFPLTKAPPLALVKRIAKARVVELSKRG